MHSPSRVAGIKLYMLGTIHKRLAHYIVGLHALQFCCFPFVVFHRNIFFRVIHLRRLGVKLVFVIEGNAPKLKYGEMNRRSQARGVGGGAGRGGRSNFDVKLREVVSYNYNVVNKMYMWC